MSSSRSRTVVPTQISQKGEFLFDVQEDDLEALDRLEAEKARLENEVDALRHRNERLKADAKRDKDVAGDLRLVERQRLKQQRRDFDAQREHNQRVIRSLQSDLTAEAARVRADFEAQIAALDEEIETLQGFARDLRERLKERGVSFRRR